MYREYYRIVIKISLEYGRKGRLTSRTQRNMYYYILENTHPHTHTHIVHFSLNYTAGACATFATFGKRNSN